MNIIVNLYSVDFNGYEILYLLSQNVIFINTLNNIISNNIYYIESVIDQSLTHKKEAYIPRILFNREIYNSILNDDVVLFNYYFTSAIECIFLIACMYNATNIAKYCIDKDFGITYKTNFCNNGFTYMCYYNNIILANYFIDKINDSNRSILFVKNKSGLQPLSYSNKMIMRPVIKRLLKLKETLHESSKFKIYNKDNFEHVSIFDNCIGRGGYGRVKPFIEKSTNKHMIVKFFNEYFFL